MLPIAYFPETNDATITITPALSRFYEIKTAPLDWEKYSTFFLIAHDRNVYGTHTIPTNFTHILCVMCYNYHIDVKDMGFIENYFSHLLTDREYHFPRCAGLLKHFVTKNP